MKKMLPVCSAAGVLLAGLLLSSCVTESNTTTLGRPTGVTLKPNGTTGAQAPAGKLPEGPLATPSTSPAMVSHVEVGVVPLGKIGYDGQTLPITSPDGQFIAVQEDEAPTWEALVARVGAMPPMRSRLAVYQIKDHGLVRIPLDQALPLGLMLGRAADDKGFLVEAPQNDGSRWIGRVAWAGGSIQWLVKGTNIAAHATLTAKDELLYISRPIDPNGPADLVLRTEKGEQAIRTSEPGWYAFPMCTQDADVAYVLHLDSTGTELQAIRVDRGPDGKQSPKFGSIIARRSVTPGIDIEVAYQIAITSPQALPQYRPTAPAPLAFLNPVRHGMCAFRIDNSSFEFIGSKTLAAVPSQDPGRPGFYATTDQGLVFVPPGTRNNPDPQSVRVVAGSFVPRQTRSTPESMILFGPIKDHPDQLDVVKVIVEAAQVTAPSQH